MKYLAVLLFICFSAAAGLPPTQSQNQGTRIAPVTTSLNFTGAGVVATAVGGSVTVTVAGSSSVTGSSTVEASFTLNDACVPYINISGPHYQIAPKTLSTVNLSMLNSGNAGSSTFGNSTVLQINQYHAGSSTVFATAVVSVIGNGGSVNSVVSTVKSFPAWTNSPLSLAIGDMTTVDVISCAQGAPEAITLEY